MQFFEPVRCTKEPMLQMKLLPKRRGFVSFSVPIDHAVAFGRNGAGFLMNMSLFLLESGTSLPLTHHLTHGPFQSKLIRYLPTGAMHRED